MTCYAIVHNNLKTANDTLNSTHDKKFKLMLTRHAKAYSSSGSVV